jgi:hypothetical protein
MKTHDKRILHDETKLFYTVYIRTYDKQQRRRNDHIALRHVFKHVDLVTLSQALDSLFDLDCVVLLHFRRIKYVKTNIYLNSIKVPYYYDTWA